jgi:predicted permease
MFSYLKPALRQLAAHPRFHLLASLTLAIGIGAASSMFSLVHGVLLRPLPFPNANRLVFIHTLEFPANHLANAPEAGSLSDTSYPDFLDWRSSAKTLQFLATYSYSSSRKFTPRNGKARIIYGPHVSAEFFQTLGVLPEYGRAFTREDEVPGTCSIMLSHDFWVAEFSADPQTIGGPIRLSDHPCTIVGVMPAGFSFPFQNHPPDFWDTAAVFIRPPVSTYFLRGDRGDNVIARLRPGISAAQANAELNSIQRSLASAFPEDRNFSGVSFSPLLASITGDLRKPLLLLFAAVTAVLLIACVNVAGLLLARGLIRKAEFSVRIALGASRVQIYKQVLLESLLLSLSGGVAGVTLAILVLKLFVAMIPADLPRLNEVHVDGPVLLFALAISVLTGLFCSILPAWSVARSDAALDLKSSRATSGTRHEHRLHYSLLVAEIAASLALLAGSGLLIRSFLETTSVHPGFDPHSVLAFRLGMSLAHYPRERAPAFLRQVQSSLATLPGVDSVSGAYPLPYTFDYSTNFNLPGVPNDPSNPIASKFVAVQPHYFETMRIPLLRGRTFTEHDTAKSKRVVIIDSEFAHQFFPGVDPIGKSIQPQVDDNPGHPWFEIIGVVGSVRSTDLTQDPGSGFYLPFEQANERPLGILLRVTGDPHTFIPVVHSKIADLDPDIPLFDINSLDDRITLSTAYARFEAQLLTAFSTGALLLAAVGLYATLSQMVARRTFEIGVRVALGAQSMHIFRLIVQRAVIMCFLGIAIGFTVYWFVARLYADLLFRVSPFDPWAIIFAITALLTTTFFASLYPALRAMRLDPIQSLREL